MQHITNPEHSSTTLQPATSDFTLSDLSILKVMFCELEEQLDAAVTDGPMAGWTKSGNFVFDMLSKVELSYRKMDVVMELLDKVILFLTASNSTPWVTKGAGLQKFSDMLRIIYAPNESRSGGDPCNKELMQKYRVYLQPEAVKQKGQTDFWAVSSKNRNKQGWEMNYWCFYPGLCMEDLLAQKIHSMILTSGTLAPLKSFACELGVPFPVQLENPHIIGDHQVFVATVAHGPDGTVLNSSYQNRANPKYIQSLGRTIVNYSRVVPGGLLVFFPSYTVLRSCITHWETSGIWQSLSAIKTVFTEPQRRDAFQESLDQFCAKIQDPESRGAVLFAVCRGKVSEGLDFADRNARAVIITGLPFPPSQDPRVKLKMSYLDDRTEKKTLSGKEWYMQQASRAVNQAVGRVIRHRDDYGAVLLCDNRFMERRMYSQLSQWVQKHIRGYQTFGASLKDLTAFFKKLDPKQVPRTLSATASQPEGKSCSSSSLSSIKKPPNTSTRVPCSIAPAWETSESIFESYKMIGLHPEQPHGKESWTRIKPKTQSIFDALEDCNASTSALTHDPEKPEFTEAKPLGIQKESNNSSELPTKKRRINVKMCSIDGPPQTSDQCTNTDDKKASVQEIWKKRIAEVKRALGTSDAYAKFFTAVTSYKTEKNVSKFAVEMASVLGHTPGRERLLENMCLILPAMERQTFLHLVLSALPPSSEITRNMEGTNNHSTEGASQNTSASSADSRRSSQ